MNPVAWLGFVFSACVFAAIFLVGILALGGDLSRQAALGAAFCGCISQFTGQDQRLFKASLVFAYSAFALAFIALVAFCWGA